MAGTPTAIKPTRGPVVESLGSEAPQAPVPAVGEVLLVSGLLTVLAALLYGSHVFNGGLYSDDWSVAANTLYPPDGSGFMSAVSSIADVLDNCRPVLIFFFPLKYTIFGTHTKYLLALSIALAVLIAVLIYAILRVLRVPWYHAGVIAGLTVAYPWFDSTRFWDSGSVASLGILFALAGLLVALISLTKSRKWHLLAVFFYLLAVLTYEITIPFVAGAGLLYLGLVGWRRAAPLWGMDLAAAATGGLWAAANTPRDVSDASSGLERVWEIMDGGGMLLGRTLQPLGFEPTTTPALLALVAVFAIGLVVCLTSSRGRLAKPGEWDLRSWLWLGLGGLIAAGFGWAMFVPADPYYTPTVFGESNRVNALAGIGLVIAVYAALGVIGALVGRVTKRRSLAIATTLVLAVTLGGAYAHVVERHSRLWESAYQAQMEGMGKIEEAFPTLPKGTTIFASGGPASQALGVPIFATTWGLTGLTQLRYEDNSLRAYPITTELELACAENGVVLMGGGGAEGGAGYGTARLVDLATGRHSAPRNQAQCLAQRNSYLPGPLYVTIPY